MTDNDLKTIDAGQRSAVYGLLAMLYRKQPGVELIERISRDDVMKALHDGGIDIDRKKWMAESPEKIAERLAIDYTGLFIIGEKQLPLNESAYKSDGGERWGKPARSVKDFLESVALTIDDGWTGLYDHLVVEFEIMKLLTQAENQARLDEDSAGVLRSRELQADFFREHFDGWVIELCGKIILRAGTAFYRELARTTRAFMKQERMRLAV